MPNYEYKCTECNASEEHHRSIEDRDIVPDCQVCGKPTTRVWQANPVHFKGSGFYSTGG